MSGQQRCQIPDADRFTSLNGYNVIVNPLQSIVGLLQALNLGSLVLYAFVNNCEHCSHVLDSHVDSELAMHIVFIYCFFLVFTFFTFFNVTTNFN